MIRQIKVVMHDPSFSFETRMHGTNEQIEEYFKKDTALNFRHHDGITKYISHVEFLD